MRHTLALTLWQGTLMGLFALASHGASARDCVSEHDTVSLSGELHRKRFPGPPNYSGVRSGDRLETIVVLTLRKPLCVMLPDDVTLTPRPKHIHELQLISDDRLPRSSDQIRHIEGTLMLAESGHHHLPVLLDVMQLKPEPKPKRTHR